MINRTSRNKLRRQHWVPRCYLRYFAIPDTRNTAEPIIWIFSKDEGDPRVTGISQIAAENYLYSPKCHDGTRHWDMENKLASLEGLAAQIWPIIGDGFIDFHEEVTIRKALALFIAILHLRHPTIRTEIGEIHHRLVEICETFPKDENGNPLIHEIEYKGAHIPFDLTDWRHYKAAGPNERHQMFIDSLTENATRCAELLLKKRWSIVVSQRPVFITTDTPVTISNPPRAIFGLGTPGTLISVPLSPTRILIMDDRHDQPDGRYYPLSGDDPAPLNLIAWRTCERFMFSSRPTDLVCAEMVLAADQF